MSSLQEHAQSLLAPQVPPSIAAPPDPVATAQAPAPDMPPPASLASDETAVVPGTGPIAPDIKEAAAENEEPQPPDLHGMRSILKASQDYQREADKKADAAFVDATKAQQDKATVIGEEATAQLPAYEQQVKNQQDQLRANQATQQKLDTYGNKYAQDFGATMQQMQDKFDNQPQDVFGRAGVNKISGTIGLILGGLAAGQTDGRNMAVERLNQLTNQKLAQDKYEYQMLGQKANMQSNVYAHLRAQGMDDIAATNAAAAIKNGVILSQLKQTDLRYAPSKAKADAAQTIAQLEAQTNQFKAQGQQHQFALGMDVAKSEIQQQEFYEAQRVRQAITNNKLQQDANAISGDATAPSPTWWKSNRVLGPRLFTTNSQLKLLDAKYQEALHTTDPTTAGILREEMASIAAQIETGIPNPADPQVEAAKARFGTTNIFNIQAGRFRPGSKEAELAGNYIQSAFENHIRSLKSAGFSIKENGDLNQTYLNLKKRGFGTPAGEQDKLNSTLDSYKTQAQGVLSASQRVNDYINKGTLY